MSKQPPAPLDLASMRRLAATVHGANTRTADKLGPSPILNDAIALADAVRTLCDEVQRLREKPPPRGHRYLVTELGTRREPPNKDGSL